ncbi:MAG TPA: beta-eliminating lyase-related protein, partial [Bdellovibrionales bacterium]|nr:beta-eliminating lyase-related protein [Bdellovibrionales bacterium]
HAYGFDEVSDLAEQEFHRVFGPGVEAHFVFNGTAANVLCLTPLLKSHEAVICADTAHLNVDECGAPEKFLGTKLLTLPTPDGKIAPGQAQVFLERPGDQHYAQPRAVSLTLPTETGLCYSLEELRAWREFSLRENLMLHLDGARLANAAQVLGLSLKALTADLGVDCVSFGGTKNGLMGAEACLLFSDRAKEGFKFHRKQAMQLPSKTRFLAAQFYAYLKDDLWRDIAAHVHAGALKLADRLKEFEEIRLAYAIQSNALFVHLPKDWIAPLKKHSFFYVWNPKTNLCRWMISFDWTDADSDRLIDAIEETRDACSRRK